MKVVLFLLLASICTCSGTFTSVVPGIYSKTVSCDELRLPSTRYNTFQPINALINTVYLSKPSSVFVNYQLTINKTSVFHTKLEIDNFDVGSIVHMGTQLYKTMTGYWMGYLNPGYYTFKIFYAGSAYMSLLVLNGRLLKWM